MNLRSDLLQNTIARVTPFAAKGAAGTVHLRRIESKLVFSATDLDKALIAFTAEVDSPSDGAIDACIPAKNANILGKWVKSLAGNSPETVSLVQSETHVIATMPDVKEHSRLEIALPTDAQRQSLLTADPWGVFPKMPSESDGLVIDPKILPSLKAGLPKNSSLTFYAAEGGIIFCGDPGRELGFVRSAPQCPVPLNKQINAWTDLMDGESK